MVPRKMGERGKDQVRPISGLSCPAWRFIEEPRCSEAILACIICQLQAVALALPPWRKGLLLIWKHRFSPWSSRNTSVLPPLFSSDWGFNILSDGRSDRAIHDKVIGVLTVDRDLKPPTER